jgi:formate dehydrogenase-N alpha subunit
MTNHWIDLKNTDCALIMGANPAENHPISFRWLTKAKEKGAKIISVDPRFTRTSSQSDIYARLRSGSDIAFVGGMINYILENKLFHEEYVVNYTNASLIVNDTYSFNDGIFSGYDEKTRNYDKTKWTFKADAEGKLIRDVTLQDPNCVFQLMKKHYSRYDIDTVVEVTGTTKEEFLKVADTFAATGKPGKAGTILYAMGTTQHTVGSQNVRAFGILQLLLGNLGLQGGGINAMRGESNVQGSTDFGLLYGNVTAYMETPTATPEEATYAGFLTKVTPKAGYWTNKPKFYTSLLKAYYGDNATAANEFGFQYMPKLTPKKDYSHMRIFDAIFKEEIEGLMMFGTNPIVGGPNAGKEQEALSKLKWMVAIDLWETETSAFWQKEAGATPADIQTEVFFLPACSSFEKEGSISNSGRWMQYRWQAIKPKHDSKGDLEILHMLALKLKDLYKNQSGPAADQIKAMTWDYGHGDHPDIDLVCREINGYETATKKLVPGFAKLMDDGSTASGCWIYSGFYPEEGKNLSKRRDNVDTAGNKGNFLNWSFAWPANRRVLANRCAAKPDGSPWTAESAGVWWDPAQNLWVGNDVPDFPKDRAPEAPGGKDAYFMLPTGLGGLFGVMNEGPFPEHYEPYESPVSNALSKVQLNPATKFGVEEFMTQGDASKYPIIATTYRVSEHWQAGAMTRNQAWLSELSAHMFVEISEELAKERGIKNSDEIFISSARGEIKAYAMVTKRFKPFTIKGKTVHQVGMPWHFGFKGIATGGTANRLTPHIGDANTNIPEYKAFLCDVRRAK